MQKLYLDCDGVILDTINTSYRMLKELGITNEKEAANFYSNINWEKLIIDSGEINNSIKQIKKLSQYFDIEILTHVNTSYEGRVKTEYFAKELPGINVIPVFKEIRKADFVNPKNAILVDDYLPNLDYWNEKGGIPVKFSDSGKECPYTIITCLLDLINIFEKDKIEVNE